MGMLLAYYKNNGYVFDIHNMSLAYIDDYICLRLSMDVPEFDMFLNFYAIETDDMVSLTGVLCLFTREHFDDLRVIA